MRYDFLLHGLERAKAQYENRVRSLIASALKQDASAESSIRKVVKKNKKAKAKHWTQRPENQKKVAAIHRKMEAAKRKKR